jgi:CheY-like chemotaxis protein
MNEIADISDGWRMRVLVVEGKADTTLSTLLGGAGHEVEVAADGETAVAAARG